MSECAECGEKFGFISLRHGPDGNLCKSCFFKLSGKGNDGKRLELAPEAQAIILTTETFVSSSVQKRLEIIIASEDCILDVNISKVQSELLQDLKRQAFDLGANAVIGVNISFLETYTANIASGEFKRFKMVAYGTAMIVDE
tara:strand:- start:686 stop:1111 length:426 start_codon:yes stop_codon:yes gene_type:complete